MMVSSPRHTLDKIHINAPQGAATEAALARTNKVLSKIDLTITFVISGFL